MTDEERKLLHPNLKPIKKGQVLNPEGSRAHDPEMKALKRLTKEELKEVGYLILQQDLNALKAMAKSSDVSVLKAMVASVSVKIINKGDMHALDILLNRLIGKVKEEVEHSGHVSAAQVLVTMPPNGSEAANTEEVPPDEDRK